MALHAPLAFSILGSGSSGNSSFVTASGLGILVDAGLSARETGRRMHSLGHSLDDVDVLLLTHEHHDHIKGLEALSKARKLTVVATAGTLRAVAGLLHAQTECWELRPGAERDLGGVTVRGFPTAHDAAGPMGYVLAAGGASLGYVTDFGQPDEALAEAVAEVDALVIESNHDLGMLRDGPYPWPLKQRILAETGHCSNEDLAEFLREAELGRCRSLTLAHLSRTNNRPELAMAAATAALAGRPLAKALKLAHHDRAGAMEAVHAQSTATAPRAQLAPRVPAQLRLAFGGEN